MTNLYEGKSVASMEMMTMEMACELIERQKIKVLCADIDQKHEVLREQKFHELDEFAKNLDQMTLSEMMQINRDLAKEINEFLRALT